MDYKKVYLTAYKKTFDGIDSHIISKVKAYRKRDKNFTVIVNQIEKDLKEKENKIRTSLNHNFPDLYELYKSRFNKYGSDHLTSYFNFNFPDLAEKYPESSLKECAVELGAYESYSLASINFRNSDKFLEAMYVLNKNYDNYTLNFDPNDSPENSDLFFEMQKERFSDYGQEISLETMIMEDIETTPERKKTSNIEKAKSSRPHPGEILDESEKLYILHLLRQFTEEGSAITTTEFLRILHLTTSIIETSADISGNPPFYRKVNDGWINYKKNDRILKLENVIAKLNRFKLPILKTTLNEKLKSEHRRK